MMHGAYSVKLRSTTLKLYSSTVTKHTKFSVREINRTTFSRISSIVLWM